MVTFICAKVNVGRHFRQSYGKQSKKKSIAQSNTLLLEAPPGIGPGLKLLQSSALPLGYGAAAI